MNGAPGQPGIMQPFLIPISLPGAGRSIVLQPGMSPAAFGMRPPASVSKMEPPPPVPVQQTPPVELYLCNTSRSAAEPPPGNGEERQKKEASLEILEHSFQELNSRKIKDSLGSFLPSVPGEFDLVETNSETKLRGLIDRPPIGGKEFLPLSGQALLGFRLLPGAQLPEPYRMDPQSLEPKQHHRKRKRKHKAIDRTDDGTDPAAQNQQGSKIPSDVYSFIKEEPLPSVLHPFASSHPQPSHSHSALAAAGSVGVPVPQKISSGRPYAPAMGGAMLSVAAAPSPLLPGVLMESMKIEKRKKKDKKNKDKRKEKKEKKKKKEKHHSQDPPPLIHTSHPVPPPLISHTPAPPYTQHQHTHTHPHPHQHPPS